MSRALRRLIAPIAVALLASAPAAARADAAPGSAAAASAPTGARTAPAGAAGVRGRTSITPAPARPRPYFDVRAEATRAASEPGAAPLRALPAAARTARGRLVARLGAQGILNADPITATPRALGRLDGTLTGPRAGDPAAIALAYVRTNAAALGLTPVDVDTLGAPSRVTSGGVTYLRWRQQVGGIPMLDNDLQASVDGDGRVVTVLGAPRASLSVASVTPALTAEEALAALARDVGVDRPATVTSGPTGPRRETVFSTGDRASLVLFGDTGAVRLAWQLTYDAGASAWYDGVVDATTGAILRRANMVKGLTNASVFRNYPGAAAGGAQDLTVDLDRYLTPGATTLTGPNAHAWSDIDDVSADALVEAPQTTEEVVPGNYQFQDFTASNGLGACDPQHQCSWDGGMALSWDKNREQNAVQAFWYVNNYHDHLAAAPIGFDAASGALQSDNGPVDVETDDGAAFNGDSLPDLTHLNNANMATPPVGRRPRMQMYLFENFVGAPFRDVNGGDDASVVYHEYTHGMSNRLIKDTTGNGALNAVQSASMGEAWSDWYAKDYLVSEGLQPDAPNVDGEVDMGAYVDSDPHQIRTEPLDCPVGSLAPSCRGVLATPGGYTFGNFAALDATGNPQSPSDPHRSGEIWGQTLWDLRAVLGSNVSEKIITGAMRISPANPSFLEERDAIMMADQTSYQGIHIAAIWAVFAHRGMGVLATTAGPNSRVTTPDTHVPADFPAPAPAPGVVAAGGATPLGVPASAVAAGHALARPTARVDRSTVRGRATVTIGCSIACRVTATMTLTRARARRVGLGRVTSLVRVTRRLGAPARRTIGLNLSRATLRRLRAKGVTSLPATVTVAIRDDRGQTRSVRRTLTVRIQ